MASRAVSIQTVSFVRDRFTWGAYLLLAYFSYLITIISLAMPFLEAELGLSYTVRALHLSAFALGMTIAGLTGDRAAKQIGRARLYWASGAGMAFSAGLLIVGRRPELTILSTFLMGLIGSYLLVMIQAVLADHHGEHRAIALTESNVCASIAAIFPALLISQAEAVGIGWRAAVVVGIILWVFIAALFYRTPLPAPHPQSVETERGRLPRVFWLFWLLVFIGVGLEWSIGFWTPTFLETVVGFSKVDAAALFSIYLVAFVISRFISSRLARRYSVKTLLLLFSALILIGFPPFWLGRDIPIVSLVGLFIMGLGIASLFPLSLSATTSLVPALSNKASARTSLGAGLGILLAPLLLGSIADGLGGIVNALLIAAALMIVHFSLTAIAWRSR